MTKTIKHVSLTLKNGKICKNKENAFLIFNLSSLHLFTTCVLILVYFYKYIANTRHLQLICYIYYYCYHHL